MNDCDFPYRIEVMPIANKKGYYQCPRCRRYHRTDRNYDNLCYRCCEVLVQIGHWTKDEILAAWKRSPKEQAEINARQS